MSLEAAVAQARAGRLGEAAATLEQLLRTHPAQADAWAMLGALRQDLGQPEAALAAFDQACGLRPDHAATEVNRANTLSQLGRPAEALQGYDAALTLDPRLAAAHSNRARALLDLGRADEAAASARAALALQPAYANAWMHLGTALHRAGDYPGALAAYEAAKQHGCAPYEAENNLGAALVSLGRHEEAAAHFEAAVAIDPASPVAPLALGLLRLAQHDFERGWAGYARRWEVTPLSASSWGFADGLRDHLAAAPSAGELKGRRLAVLAEQGVGDQIMFASMLPDLTASGAQVTFICEPRLAGLFAASFPEIRVIPADAAGALRVGQFDLAIAMGSLGGAYRPSVGAFPGTPYLKPRDTVAAAWRARLGPKTRRLRIGVSWRGGAATTGASARSMTLATLRPLLLRDDCEFVSLQYGEVRAEVESADVGLPQPIRLFDKAQIDDLEDLAGLISALDLVVSVQNTAVHLSGALGVPCLTLIPRAPEWRYGIAGEGMPWYGSVRLFRQTDDAGWPPAVARVAAAVADAQPREA